MKPGMMTVSAQEREHIPYTFVCMAESPKQMLLSYRGAPQSVNEGIDEAVVAVLVGYHVDRCQLSC